MKKITLLVFIFCSLRGASQNSFFNLYPYPVDTLHQLSYVIPTHDNGLVGINGWGYVTVLKFDSIQQNSWIKKFKIPGHSLTPEEIIELKNHDLMIAGEITLGPRDGNFLLRIDSAGNLLSMKIDSDSAPFIYPSFAGSTPDGGFILCGHSNGDTASWSDGILIKFDSVQNVQWKIYFKPDTSAFFSSEVVASIASDGSIVATGFYFYQSNWNNAHFSVTKFDSSGVLQWSRHSPLVSHLEMPGKALEKNGSYYIATEQDTPTASTAEPHLYKVSSQTGELQWHMYYSDFNIVIPPRSRSLINKVNDRIIGVGTNDTLMGLYSMSVEFDSTGGFSNSQLYTSNVNGNQYGFFSVMETAAHLPIASGYEYNMTENTVGNVLATLDTSLQTTCFSFQHNLHSPVYYNDTLISSGSSYSASETLLDITSLVQVTSDTVMSKQDFCFFVGVNESEIESLLIISPNPTTGKIKIVNEELRIESISIYNMLGKKVLAVTGCGLTTVDCGLLPSGIYILQASSGEKILHGKVIKE